MSERVWTSERYVEYALVTGIDLSPDGRWLVCAVREPLLSDDESRFVSHLYRVSVADGTSLRLTYGAKTHLMPRWSPDGRLIAFLSDREGGKRNVCVMDAFGGEPWPLTNSEKHVQSFAWAPDGGHLAVCMAPADSESKKRDRKAKNDVQHFGVDHDNVQLWSVPLVSGGKEVCGPAPLSAADRHVTGVAWLPTGEGIVYTHQPTPVADDWIDARLAIVRVRRVTANGSTTLLASATRDLGAVASDDATLVAGDGWVAAVCGVEPATWTKVQEVRRFDVETGEATVLAQTPDARPYLLGLSAGGDHVLALEASGTLSAVYALPLDGGDAVEAVVGQGYLSEVRCNGQGSLAVVRQLVDEPNHVCVVAAVPTTGDHAQARVERVFDPQSARMVGVAVPETVRRRWRSGDLEIEGLLTLPLAGTGEPPYPTVVIVHGGPMSVFGETFVGGPGLYPIAAFAEGGFAILRVNPRGSTGYGPTFRQANLGAWGGHDFGDILSGLDSLVDQGVADADRLGIMGWSYGGYMTSWAITQTDRFRAASVGAGVTNLMSMVGTTDIPGLMPDYMGCEYWDDLEPYRRCSPMFHVGNVRTPTLIQHGRDDVRVPLSQGMELYRALVRQGVETEFYIYPRQKHGPDEPRLIMDIIERNLAWFKRWLLGDDGAGGD